MSRSSAAAAGSGGGGWLTGTAHAGSSGARPGGISGTQAGGRARGLGHASLAVARQRLRCPAWQTGGVSGASAWSGGVSSARGLGHVSRARGLCHASGVSSWSSPQPFHRHGRAMLPRGGFCLSACLPRGGLYLLAGASSLVGLRACGSWATFCLPAFFGSQPALCLPACAGLLPGFGPVTPGPAYWPAGSRLACGRCFGGWPARPTALGSLTDCRRRSQARLGDSILGVSAIPSAFGCVLGCYCRLFSIAGTSTPTLLLRLECAVRRPLVLRGPSRPFGAAGARTPSGPTVEICDITAPNAETLETNSVWHPDVDDPIEHHGLDSAKVPPGRRPWAPA